MMKKIKLVIAIALGTANLYAQDTLSISKNDLLQKVIETETKVARDYQKAISSKNGNKDKELVTTLRMTIVGFD